MRLARSRAVHCRNGLIVLNVTVYAYGSARRRAVNAHLTPAQKARIHLGFVPIAGSGIQALIERRLLHLDTLRPHRRTASDAPADARGDVGTICRDARTH